MHDRAVLTLASLLKALERLCICRCATLLKKSSSASLSVRAWRSGYWAGNANASALSRSTCSCASCVTQSAPRAILLLLRYITDSARWMDAGERTQMSKPARAQLAQQILGPFMMSYGAGLLRCGADLADGKVVGWQRAPQLSEENGVHQLGRPVFICYICSHAECSGKANVSASL